MTPATPTSEPTGGEGPARRRAAAVLVLTAVALLVPLLGPQLALDGTGEGTAPGSAVVTALRALMLGALCVHAGELFGLLLVRRLTPTKSDEPAAPGSWATGAAVVGFLAALGLALIVSTGNLVTLDLSRMDVGGLYGTRDGALALITVNGFLAAALCAGGRRPGLAALPLFAVVVAEALRAHPEVHSPLFGSALTLVHLVCAALWTGGLLYVLRVLYAWRRAAPARGTALLGAYSRVALVLFAALTVTGVVSAARRLPPDDLLTTAYGRVLLAKVLLVAVVAVLAVLARRRLRGQAGPVAVAAPARAEVLVLFVVVAVSALLTAMPLPVFYRAAFWWTWF
ncbi:CopD family protein [Streptomyces sp. XM4193]|uniref:CopD family protein n=1 Tax=Streptomyces sp. XM4193 TaxID=2929782 RepID=UPI001FFBA688|nr:CopD family protein [Streptomyces sp. XM4193]MCK1796379.1 CopD family protein [Streptomyces sp. XM4193]